MIASAVASVAAAFAALALASPPGVAPHGVAGCDVVAGPPAPDLRFNQLALGHVAMPGRFLAQIVDQEDPYPLRYWRKAGIHVRAGTGPVDIVVPAAWRDRVAITFGEGDNAPGWVSTLRIAKCKPYGRKWLPYGGGFTVSEPACVPLIVRAGGRSQTLHFGIGRRC